MDASHFTIWPPPMVPFARHDGEDLVVIAEAWRRMFLKLPFISPSPQEYVYYIHAEGTDYVKIGYSLNPQARLCELPDLS